MEPERQFRLRWPSHQGTLLSMFDSLFSTGSMVDVTLACEGQYINAHKIVLSACSPYFHELLSLELHKKNPIVILTGGIKYSQLLDLIQFMYRGEISVAESELDSLITVAKSLKIRGMPSESSTSNVISSELETIIIPSFLPQGLASASVSTENPESTAPPTTAPAAIEEVDRDPPGPGTEIPNDNEVKLEATTIFDEDIPADNVNCEQPISAASSEAPKKIRKRGGEKSQSLHGIPPIYQPSEWFASQKPCTAPYWPQIGDEVVYFRQGHELYINAVMTQKSYTIDEETLQQLPWKSNPNLEPQVACRIESVGFEILPPRLVTVTLAVEDWETGEPTGTIINVSYHTIKNNGVDFIILKQLYDSTANTVKDVKSRVRCLRNSNWCLGIIIAVAPYSPDFPDSKFLRYKVLWDNNDGDEELLSPWDIEDIPYFKLPEYAQEDGITPADEEDACVRIYDVQTRDWASYEHKEAELNRISKTITDIMKFNVAKPFAAPVDLKKWPDYALKIAYPMDLSTIKARLDNMFYRRLEAIKFDIKYISINAEIYNGAESDLAKASKIIRDLCLLISSEANLDVVAEYDRLLRTFEFVLEPVLTRTTLKKKRRGRPPKTAKKSPSSLPMEPGIKHKRRGRPPKKVHVVLKRLKTT